MEFLDLPGNVTNIHHAPTKGRVTVHLSSVEKGSASAADTYVVVRLLDASNFIAHPSFGKCKSASTAERYVVVQPTWGTTTIAVNGKLAIKLALR